MEQQIRSSVGQGVPVIAFTLVGEEMRVCGNKSFVDKFCEDLLGMSKMEELLKGNGALKDSR